MKLLRITIGKIKMIRYLELDSKLPFLMFVLSDCVRAQRCCTALAHKGGLRSNQSESNKSLAARLVKIGGDWKTFNKLFLFLYILAVWFSWLPGQSGTFIKVFTTGRYLNSCWVRTRQSKCVAAINWVLCHWKCMPNWILMFFKWLHWLMNPMLLCSQKWSGRGSLHLLS